VDERRDDMTRINWGLAGERFYQTGVDRGVLYVAGGPGVPWNGLTSVSENPSGGEERSYYIDGVKYLNLSGVEEYYATIQAFTYPNEFEACDGSEEIFNGLFLTQRRRQSFGFSYRTKIGNDIDGLDHGYKIHLVYNAVATPSNRVNGTINDSIEPFNFSWTIATRPLAIPGQKHTAHFVIDSRLTDPLVLADLENFIYGSDTQTPQLPTQEELFNIFQAYSGFVVVDNGDGTFTVTGPDDVIEMLDATTFQITWPSAIFIDTESYTISSP
jgi:hypothetical protein